LYDNLKKLEKECKASWDYLAKISKNDNSSMRQKINEYLTDVAQRIHQLNTIHNVTRNRWHGFLLYFGYAVNEIPDQNPNEVFKMVTEFALEYRTTREKILQQRKRMAEKRERNKTRGKIWALEGTADAACFQRHEEMSRMLTGLSDGGDGTLRRRVKPPGDTNICKDTTDPANDSPEDEILNGLVKAATLQSETRDHRRKARQFNRKSSRDVHTLQSYRAQNTPHVKFSTTVDVLLKTVRDVKAAVKRKKESFKLWQKTRAPEHLTVYRKLKRLAKTAVAKAKNAEMDALYEKLDGPEGEKFAIRLAKARHRASLDIRVVKTVKSADDRVLRKPVEVRERWEEYFKELLNEKGSRREAEEEQPKEGAIPPWTQEEVCKAIRKMKLGKAAGPDYVPVEAWKVLGDLGIKWLTQFLNRITKEGKMPDDWRNSTIVPIFKQKGDAFECSNYRIKLISHTMKIYERLVDSRLREM
uniref:FH2 domain-containing protein n=1 Tax=Heligmosomoides polygyrus TaxID=6339 RepID=A0A183GLM9_HELPZ